MSRSELKQNAKNSLKGKYKEAIKLILLTLLISFVGSIVAGIINSIFKIDPNSSSVASIISIIISGLLGFGQYSFFLKLSRNEEVTYKELFNKTNLFWSFICISFLVGLFTTLWTLLLIIPGIIAAISYSQVFFIKLDNPEIDPLEAIKQSKNMMKGHKFDYFILELSFIGWQILGIFTLGILYLWLVPYMQVTMANFYNMLKNEQ